MRTTVVVAAMVLTSLTSFAQTWTISIPNRSLYSVCVNPSNPAIIYAGNVARTMFKSTDAGITWNELLIGDGGGSSEISMLKVHPRDNSVIYAGGIGFMGIDRSTDEGETWENVLNSTDGFRFEVGGSSAVAFHPNNPDTMFAIRLNNGVVYRSGNSGSSWDSLGVPPGLIGTDRMRAITVCPDSTNVLLAGGRRAYVFRSSDGGHTWAAATHLNTIQPDMDLANFEWSKNTPGMVYATAGYSLRENTRNGGLLFSSDYGLTWQWKRFVDTSLYALMIHGTPNGDEIYVGGNQVNYPVDSGYIRGDSLIYRINAGDSSLQDLSDCPWTENEVGDFGSNVWGFAVTERGGNPVLVMATTGGLFLSDQITSVSDEETTKIRNELQCKIESNGLSVTVTHPPGYCQYRIATIDGRIVAEGSWQGSETQVTIGLNSDANNVYIVQLLSATCNLHSLVAR